MLKFPVFRASRWGEIAGCTIAAGLVIWVLAVAVYDSRERRSRAGCLTNLRLVGQAMGQYVQDNDDCWPDDGTWLKGEITNKPGGLAGCPGAKPMQALPGMKAQGIPGYSYNHLLSVKAKMNAGSLQIYPTRTGNIAFPATTVSVCEEAIGISTTMSADPYVNMPSRPAGQEQGWKRHRGGAHYLFCDGHVQWYREGVVRDFSDMGGNDGKTPAFFIAAGIVPEH